VAEQLGEIHDIDPRNLRVVHLKLNSHIKVCDLHKTDLGFYETWFEAFGRHETIKTLLAYRDDGNMLLVQDSSEELRTFTAEENSMIERLKPSYDWNVNYGTGSGYKNRRPVERGIKIKTQADWEREEQEEKSSKEDSESQNITVNAKDYGSVSTSGTSDSIYLFDDIS